MAGQSVPMGHNELTETPVKNVAQPLRHYKLLEHPKPN